MQQLKVLELFGGIGACSKALERLGIEYEIADYVEIDKYAVKSFNAMNGTNFEPQDIMSWNKDIIVDLIMHGSPCQDFSIAGKQVGGDKDSGTRSSLMYETIRIVEKLKPKYVIWENVKNLLSKKHRHNFDNYLSEMEQLGYANYYQVLNAKDYGIPQNRERVFVISIRKDIEREFEFPPKQKLELSIENMIEYKVNSKFYLDDKWFNNNINYQNNTVCETRYDEGIRLFKNNICGSLRTIDACGNKAVIQDNKIRKLTPKECWRLMGFDDEDFDKAAQVNSKTQLYKQAGNSIVVNVLEAIFKELFKEEEK